MKLVICCTGTADVPFIDRGATTLFELFRLTNALKLVISWKKRLKQGEVLRDPDVWYRLY